MSEKYLIISSLNREINQLKHQLLELETGFKAGDLVQNYKGEKGILAYGEWADSWYWNKLKIDGSPSKNRSYIGITAREITKAEVGE